jgi:hypothetical protein
MADGHGRVAVQQQQRQRLADDVAAPHHHRVPAGDKDSLLFEEFDHARGRAGDQ